MKLFLQPNDTFFFRDGKPFTKGEQSEGHSIFPPLPSTVLGALRTAYIAEFGNLPLFYSGGMQDMIGTRESLCNAIQLRGVFLANGQDNRLETFFPVPLDLIYKKSDEQDRNIPLHLLSPISKNFASNGAIDCPLTWSIPESIDSDGDGLLPLGAIKRYLRGNTDNLLLTNRTMLIEKESKTGITRSKGTLSSEDHMLYRIDMSRFKNSDGNYGFVVDYECSKKLPEKGLLKLGGEGKSFVYEHKNFDVDLLSTRLEESVKNTIQSTNKFKLYFATPTIFHQGWLPSWLNSETLSGKYPIPDPDKSPISLKLITAAVGKPISIGGWNMAKGEPKPTYSAVPAGSVYYFELIDKNRIDDLVDAFHYQNISDERSEEGFGLAFISG
ncbi:MAG: type III-B CRISPR module-associated protein Cmr3 [Candidatus Poribacteria bacterium]|nr:type III-B CRISPR module-associated protein Cmr3 [Candidatus Poribacteria bacterium]